MRITFDPDFDGGHWPGPLRAHPEKKAVVGEAWVGPFLLQKTLETALGLGGLVPSQSERIISLAKAVRSQEGFWSRSAAQDPIGVARTLLRWIDWLKMHGWKGQAFPFSANAPRLNDLAKLVSSIPPGTPDYLNAISAALDKRQPDIESIETFEPVDRLLPLWREIFAKLAARGVKIRDSSSTIFLARASESVTGALTGTQPNASDHSSPEGRTSGRTNKNPRSSSRESITATSAASDLRRALTPGFIPAGDGSLLLFRPFNPLDAAESVAAWLTAHGDLSDTIIIAPDVALDDALRRFGLPVTGAKEIANDDPFLQVLPLVLAMGWDPPDPQRALELLLLDNGPVPGFIARGLRAALQEWPSVGSPRWDEALSRGLDRISDSANRADISERLNSIFRPDAKIHAPYPASALKLRAQAVKKWAAARRHSASASDPASSATLPASSSSPDTPHPLEKLDAVIAQCASFEKLVDLAGFNAFTETQLLKLNLEIAESIRSHRRYEPQAGLASVPSPGAIISPARRVVWWDFSIESAPSPFSLPLSRAELAALESAHISLTPAASLASDQARRARRPFAAASETLLLVCPRFGEDGEERHHHPLWDEVSASRAQGASLAPIEPPHLPLPRPLPTRTAPLLPVPSPKRSWSVPPALVAPPSHHSPSSLGDLIGCPLKWALNSLGRLRPPEIASLKDSDALIGSLSHHILGEVLAANPPDRAAARALAEDLFDRLGPRLAAPLFLPGAPVQQALSRKATADAASDLVDILRAARLPVAFIEHSASAQARDLNICGRLDLVVGDPDAAPVVIDLKWSRESFYRDKLKDGTAHQLAAYAFIMKKGKTLPPVAYFIIRSQRLIAHAASVSPGSPFVDAGIDAVLVDSPPLADTWDALLATTHDRIASIKTGRFEALAIDSAASASAPTDDSPDDESDDASTPKKDALTGDGRLTLVPPCKYCSYGVLCGRIWEDA